MWKHKFMIRWMLIYFIIVCVCISLVFYFQILRIRLAILLCIILVSFIFYPIFFLDKKSSQKIKAEQNQPRKKKSKPEITPLMEQASKTESSNLGIKEEYIDKRSKTFCKFCGKKIEEDAKTCPYCRTDIY